MALVTLQGATVPGVVPAVQLRLSHSLTYEDPYPKTRIFRQFVKTSTTGPHPVLHGASVQTLFQWFRNAGPLVSVKTGVNIGYPEPVISLEYWDGQYANRARTLKNKIHSNLENSPEFVLRTYDPCKLYCAVSRWLSVLGGWDFVSFWWFRCLEQISEFGICAPHSARYCVLVLAAYLPC